MCEVNGDWVNYPKEKVGLLVCIHEPQIMRCFP